ncbi:MAG TPA: glycine zipper family protein [Thermohalobaculum sp.]|nr:glycine zipper family protein [Thermohalobaculum sp.]
MRSKMMILAVVATLMLGACTEHTARTSLQGGLIGGATGLVVGSIFKHPVKNAARGAVLGAAAGALVGTIDDAAEGRQGYGY